ncbi:MAG: hypothetical protein ACTSRZ_13075 [Promethearchaeota archaeon]
MYWSSPNHPYFSDKYIRAHVVVYVLSLLLISILRLKLTKQSVAISYDVLLGKLRSIYVKSKGRNAKEGRIVMET